jgi:hypothetical protein
MDGFMDRVQQVGRARGTVGAPRGREEVASPSRTHPGGRGGHLPLQTRPGPSQRYIEHFDVSVTLPSSLTL